jgi:hypothetical protein
MNWTECHARSEQLAAEAAAAARAGEPARARSLYLEAAGQEVQALHRLAPGKPKTLGVTAVSAASLWFKGGDLREAERVACGFLARDDLPSFAAGQLQSILSSVWNERHLRDEAIEFSPGEALVRIAGGRILHGGAPLELVHLKIQQVRSLFYRTIEMLLGLPLRRRGVPSAQIQEQFCPWLLHAPASSYQFAVRVQKPAQLHLFDPEGPEVQSIVQKTLDILSAAGQEDQAQLDELVPDPDYCDVFLKLARDLAPTGSIYERLEIRSATALEAAPITLTQDTRQVVNSALRARRKVREEHAESAELPGERLTGVLRALHLDNDWLEVTLLGKPDIHVKIYDASDVIDDIVGPLVNRQVVIDAVVRPDGTRSFRDIQSNE